MKRLLTSLAFVLCSLLTFAQFSGSGNGTEDDPYLIFNETQLSQMVNFLNQEGVVFKLMKDLNLTNWIAENNPKQGWVPVGVSSTPFKGKFYGNNHKITGLMINRTSTNHVGFFGYVTDATIDNLTIEGNSVTGSNYVGGFVGYVSNSTITNCHLKLTGEDGVKGTNYVGGFSGYSISTTYTTFSSSTPVSGSLSIGGFVGYINGGTFMNGTIAGTVTATGNDSGGFTGYVSSATLTSINLKCTVTGQSRTGGVAGYSTNGNFSNCTYEGNLTGTESVGGIVGSAESTTSSFTNCFTKGEIIATGNYTGGIIGVCKGACVEKLENCSHFGDITGKSYIGGLVGAILNMVEAPELYTYMGCKGNNSEPTGDLYIVGDERVITGESIIKSVNNCTAIGNIVGESHIGGLIGSETAANGYTTTPVKINRTIDNSYYTLYKFKLNQGYRLENRIGYSGYSPFDYYYNIYTRNTISYALTNSYYSGTLQGVDNIGGLYGYKSGGTIQNNFAYANIYGSSNVGGIVGKVSDEQYGGSCNITTLKSNVAINATVSATVTGIGRIYGTNVGGDHLTIGALASAEGNRALTQTTIIQSGVVQEIEDDLQNGTSIGPSLLRLKATYVSMGWNFDENWDILETECYPYKKYQAAPPVIESNLVSQATSISGKSLNGGTVYLYYKGRDAVATLCDGHQWTFTTEALQSGAPVQIYADVDGMTPSYFTTTNVRYPGSGTEDDPYRIYTAEDLQGACNLGYYKLMNDIDLTSWINENSPTKGWIPVGRNSGESTYIDGDGHKVTGLWINTPNEDFTGLFSNFSAGQIKNLNVEVASGKKVRGGDYTGVLIGRNANGRLINCSVKGDVEGTVHVGGVVGLTKSTTINALDFDGSVKSTINNAYVGGIVGQMVSCTMTSCRSVSTITVTGSENSVGGLVGQAKDGNISKSTSDNKLNASGANNYVGGLVGYSETSITQCFSTGNITATGDDSYTGGLVGYALAAIDNSYSTVKTNGTLYTAGLVGYSFSTIDKCYAKGDVYGSVYGGGVVAELDGANAALTNSVACNNILSLSAQSAWGSRVIGGYKNGALDPDESNYALKTMQVSVNGVSQTKEDDIVEGQARTVQQLMQAATYQQIGWDCSNVWGVDEGLIYPYLLWEVDVNPVADISFDKTNLLIAVGKSETISANVLPLGATNKRLIWTSSNNNVATVADGVVTAVAVGNATITAASTDGSNISATCKVTVTANHDAAIAELQSIVDRAQSLYDNSKEGENIGEYAQGSRATLLTTINSVKAKISSTMSDDAISQCTNEINAAINLFQSKQVTAGEDTDISLLANTIYLERVEAAAGSQVRLSVKMKNTVEVQGYQFDLYLPEGVTVATDEDGFVMAMLSTARTTINKTNYFDTAPTNDGGLRVLCGSSKGYTFSGNDGEVAIITLNISQHIDEGEHAIILKEVKLSDPSSTPYNTEYLKSTLVISSYTLGDVNADGSIDVADFIAVANHILGNTVNGFVEKAADANEDGSIDVSDFIAIANMILRQQATGGKLNKVAANALRKVSTNINDLENAIYVEPIIASPGTQQVLSVKMKNVGEVAGFEFNLQLPEGVTVATDDDDMNLAVLSTERTSTKRTNYFDTSLQTDGTLKVLCGTSVRNPNTDKLYVFSGNDGEVARITVNVSPLMTEGEYTVIVKNAILSDPDAEKTTLPSSIESGFFIGDNSIVLDETSPDVPDASDGEVTVKVKRTIKANEWSTLVLPFDMTEEQVKEAFGDDVQLAEFTDYEADYDDNDNVTGLTVNFEATDLTEGFYGNYPYLVKTSKDITEFIVTATVDPDESEAVAEYDNGKSGKNRKVYGSLIGTYHAGDAIPANGLFLNGNKFYYSTGKTKIKAFRAYFMFNDVLSSTGAEAKMRFIVDEEPTTINGIGGTDIIQGAIYNMNGQLVGKDLDLKTLPKGIYYVDGKKVAIY